MESAFQVNLETWSTARFDFDQSARGSMSYVGPADLGSGGIDFVRLTDLSGLDCALTGQDSPLAEISGSWFNPEQPGHGQTIAIGVRWGSLPCNLSWGAARRHLRD